MKNLFLALAFIFIGSIGFANENSNLIEKDESLTVLFSNYYNIIDNDVVENTNDYFVLDSKVAESEIFEIKADFKITTMIFAPCSHTTYYYNTNGQWIGTVTEYSVSLSCSGHTTSHVMLVPQLASL